MKSVDPHSFKDTGAHASAGVILFDLSLKPIAYDAGAEAILARVFPSWSERATLEIPSEMLGAIRNHTGRSLFKTADCEYVCRSYLVKPHEQDAMEPLFALVFQRGSSTTAAVQRLAEQYQLTRRERETLVGISAGQSTKELATTMKISVNTVKSYMRLIMLKMEVPSRAGIMAKLLENNTAG